MRQEYSYPFGEELKRYLEERSKSDPFQYLLSRMCAEQLEERIKRKPFSKKSLENLFRSSRIIIKRDWLPFSGEMCASGPNEFTIIVSNGCSKNQELITLAHELVHVFYKVVPPFQYRSREPKENDKVEDLIELEAARFLRYSENREYLRGLLASSPRAA